jgi:glutamyl-tRNA synthetase
MKNIRTRIAPSPSSDLGLHLGNIRTAIFNYLIAKKTGGQFVYRLENTDLARNSDKGIAAIKASFEWLGIIPDEGYDGYGGDFGPYSQLERLDLYKKFADQLIDENKAYRCFCTQEDINAERENSIVRGKKDFKYSGRCRDRKDQPKDKDYVVRLKTTTEGYTEYTDLIFGVIQTPNKEIQDPVLIRSNGVCLYNWGCVIDDITMKIDLCLRGRDHHINTPLQLLMYQALGAIPPQFAHLPLMLSPDGKSKLSKRTATVSVLEYKNMGYVPQAVISYLAKFGWGYANQEIFTIDELIEKFSLEACGKSDGRFDAKKFAAIQCHHLKTKELISDEQYALYLTQFLLTRGVELQPDYVKTLIPLVRTRSHTLIEAANELEPIYKDNVPNKELVEKILTTDARNKLANFRSVLSNIDNWSEENLKNKTQEWLVGCNSTIKDIGQPARVSIYGRTNSPDLFQVMSVLGKETTINRITRAIT